VPTLFLRKRDRQAQRTRCSQPGLLESPGAVHRVLAGRYDRHSAGDRASDYEEFRVACYRSIESQAAVADAKLAAPPRGGRRDIGGRLERSDSSRRKMQFRCAHSGHFRHCLARWHSPY
jgi:hypothetical protein